MVTFVVNTRTSHPLQTATRLEVSLNEADPAVSLEREVRTTCCCILAATPKRGREVGVRRSGEGVGVESVCHHSNLYTYVPAEFLL